MKFKKPFKPMLLHEISKPFDDENYIFELNLTATEQLFIREKISLKYIVVTWKI